MEKPSKIFLRLAGLSSAHSHHGRLSRTHLRQKVLADGQAWIDMLDHRNLLSHTYDFSVFEKAVDAIFARYLPAMDSLHDYLIEQALK